MEILKKRYIRLHLTRGKDYMPDNFVAKRVPKHYFLTKDEKVIHSFLGYWNADDFLSLVADVENRKKELRK